MTVTPEMTMFVTLAADWPLVTESVTLMVKSLKAGDEAVSRVSSKVRVRVTPLTDAELSCGGVFVLRLLGQGHRDGGVGADEGGNQRDQWEREPEQDCRRWGGTSHPGWPCSPGKERKSRGGDRPTIVGRVKEWDAGEAN